MPRHRSAYDVLDLQPGAGRHEIDEAYRRLIKRHHPDRPGGDTARAEEIIRAYRALRPNQPLPESLQLNERPGERGIGRGWQALALLLAIVILLLALFSGPLDAIYGNRFARIDLPGPIEAVIDLGGGKAIEQPIDGAAVDRVIDDAHAAFNTSDEAALAAKSRDCHQSFRQRPAVATLDRCVAFDDTVITLQDRDPLRDQGPFREVAMVRRHWGEAARLSNDNVAIDSRLDRLRLRVELRISAKAEVEAAGEVAFGATDSAENLATANVVIPDDSELTTAD